MEDFFGYFEAFTDTLTSFPSFITDLLSVLAVFGIAILIIKLIK